MSTFSIPPLDISIPKLPGPITGLLGMPETTTPTATNLRAFGVGETKAPVSSIHSGKNNFRTALQESGIGGETKPSKFASMLGNVGSGVSILGDLAQIYFGFQEQRQAKKQFGAQVAFANANYENQVTSYNTRLADLYKARGFTQGDSDDVTNQAITANSLNFKRIKG